MKADKSVNGYVLLDKGANTMKTWEELKKKYPGGLGLSEEHNREFINDVFDVYESAGELAETFWTPYKQYEDRIGQKFKVIRRLTEDEADLECLPMWRIGFEDGVQTDAYPEEIYKREQEYFRKKWGD